MRGTFQVEPWSSSGGTWFMLPLSIDLRYSTDNLKAMFPASSWFCILKSDSNSTVSNSSNYRDYHRLQVEVVQILTPNYGINCTLIPLIAWILSRLDFCLPLKEPGSPRSWAFISGMVQTIWRPLFCSHSILKVHCHLPDYKASHRLLVEVVSIENEVRICTYFQVEIKIEK